MNVNFDISNIIKNLINKRRTKSHLKTLFQPIQCTLRLKEASPMMTPKSLKLNPCQKNGLHTLAPIVDSEIKIVSSSAPIKLVENGSATKEYLLLFILG